MGWCDSPAYFCAAYAAARDVADNLAKSPPGSLPAHPLEGFLLRPQDWPEDTLATTSEKFTRLMEVYIDEFIQLAPTTDPDQLLHLSRAVLHGNHSVFPPPAVTDHDGETPSHKRNWRRVLDCGLCERRVLAGFAMGLSGVSNCHRTRSPYSPPSAGGPGDINTLIK